MKRIVYLVNLYCSYGFCLGMLISFNLIYYGAAPPFCVNNRFSVCEVALRVSVSYGACMFIVLSVVTIYHRCLINPQTLSLANVHC